MQPFVSIIIPCFNEEKTILFLLDAIDTQTYPAEKIEVLIADGLSTDNTRAMIEGFLKEHPAMRLKIIDNHARIIPAGLNRAIENATGEIIVRLDAHSGPHPEYIERCVDVLLADKAENVGGIWNIRPGAPTWVAASIAVAAAHPLGVGDALYRHASAAAYVDTVPFGAFRRTLVEKIGLFDETLLANEDYEFNARIRLSGGRIWLDPAIRSVYFSRSTFSDLARQYWRYGYWKLRMLKRYPKTVRWRQALPPLFVTGLISGAIAGLFIPFFAWVWLAAVVTYLVLLFAAGLIVVLRESKPYLLVGLPAAILCMHLSWGSGFLWSLFSLNKRHQSA